MRHLADLFHFFVLSLQKKHRSVDKRKVDDGHDHIPDIPD